MTRLTSILPCYPIIFHALFKHSIPRALYYYCGIKVKVVKKNFFNHSGYAGTIVANEGLDLEEANDSQSQSPRDLLCQDIDIFYKQSFDIITCI